MPTDALTVRDHMTLRLAFTPFTYPAARATRALQTLNLTETRFWQRVDYLLTQPAALRAYPTDVRRLRRLRDARAQQRTSRRPAAS